MNIADFKVKEKLEGDGMDYLLLSMCENELLPQQSVANIIAVDKKGNIVWTVEPPTTKYDIYARMYFKGDNFFAVSSAGQLHQINEKTGKIISSKMLK